MPEAKKKEQEVVIEEVPRGSAKIAGQIKMSADVVATIAAMAAREIEGVHSLGRSSLMREPASRPVTRVGDTK